ncbi:MAG: hypothetical protein ABII12_11125 [Planctomycetota bacterium]
MKTQRYLWNASIVLVFVFALMATGCNAVLVGSWKTEGEPKDQPFYKSMTFKDDNTYTAIAKTGDEVSKDAGTFDFDGASLKLKTPGQSECTYKASYNAFTSALVIQSGDKKQTFKKQ